MRNRFMVRLVAVLAVLSIGLGVGGAEASSSVSNASGIMTGQKASSADPGYYGRLTAKGTACVVAEWKDGGGQWRRYGFWQGQFELTEFRVCYNNAPNFEDYRFHTASSGPLYGLRYVSNTGQTKVLCEDSAGASWVCSSKLA